jgi:hypothetical protein
MRNYQGINVSTLAFIGLGVLACSIARAGDTPAWALDYLRAWYSAFDAGDAATVGNLYSDDAVFGSSHGRAAIVSSLKRDLATTSYNCAGRFQAMKEVAGTAVGWGIGSGSARLGKTFRPMQAREPARAGKLRDGRIASMEICK